MKFTVVNCKFPMAAAVIGELVEERTQLQARIAELEEELKYNKQPRDL